VKPEKRYLSPGDLYNFHTVIEDFSRFLIEKEDVEKEIAESPNFQSGINFGIRSALILLNDFILTSEGKIDQGQLEKLFNNVLARKK